MFDKIFKGKTGVESKSNESAKAASLNPQTESLLRAIAEKKKEDPQIGLKIGAKEINSRIMGALKTRRAYISSRSYAFWRP